jgi:hypothetical protein
MNDRKYFPIAGSAGGALGVVLLATLTGCIGYVDRPHGEVYAAPGVIVVEDDYVYYPTYEVYYSSHRHQYAYLEGGAWVWQPAPRGVSVDVLFASPSVRMDFHDAPARHHAQVVREYPRNWAPPGENHGRQEKQKDNQRDERREDHGR